MEFYECDVIYITNQNAMIYIILLYHRTYNVGLPL